MRLRHSLFVVLLARVVGAQSPDTSLRVADATVSGVVRDSIARAPLAGAMVQILSADNDARFRQSVSADSLGRFRFTGVPDGRYVLGFFHPILDSLFLEPTLREISVIGQRSVVADLGVPSPARLRQTVCGTHGASTEGALVVGVVRDAATRQPLGGVSVAGEWLEVTIGRGGASRQTQRLVSRTVDDGWFAMCNAPSGGTMRLRAFRGGDSTSNVEVRVPAEGFLRREIFLGSSHTVAARAAHVERLSGTVVTADGARPIAGARVVVQGGPQTYTNELGEWALPDVPAGTRTLELRALGYYPEDRAVDVVPGAKPLRFALSTVRAVLDTVRITAKRRAGDLNEFEGRRRSGAGVFLTAQDIQRRGALQTSDIFRNMSGVHLQNGVGTDVRLLVRGNMMGWCSPAIFLDGARISGTDGFAIPGITLEDLDMWVRPEHIAGIEVYAGTGAPAQYQQHQRAEIAKPAQASNGAIMALTATPQETAASNQVRSNPGEGEESNCGTILIWKKADAP